MDEQPKKKKWMFIPVLLAAVGGPYALVNGDAAKLLSSLKPAAEPTHQDALPLFSDQAGHTNSVAYPVPQGGLVVPAASAQGHGPRLEGPAVQDLAEVIRFDISPRWIAERWARVSTCTAELELEGLRVPLVTGPRADDIAGSLTYYFDKHHIVQRVTFHGTTGDERRLVMLLMQMYNFKEQPSLGGGMFVTAYNGKPSSVLRISYAPVVMANAPNTQKQIALEINRPGKFYGLSEEMKQLVNADQAVRRW